VGGGKSEGEGFGWCEDFQGLCGDIQNGCGADFECEFFSRSLVGNYDD